MTPIQKLSLNVIDGTASDSEKQELDDCLDRDPDSIKEFIELAELEVALRNCEPSDGAATAARVMERIAGQTEQTPRGTVKRGGSAKVAVGSRVLRRTHWFAALSSVAALLFVGFSFWMIVRPSGDDEQQITSMTTKHCYNNTDSIMRRQNSNTPDCSVYDETEFMQIHVSEPDETSMTTFDPDILFDRPSVDHEVSIVKPEEYPSDKDDSYNTDVKTDDDSDWFSVTIMGVGGGDDSKKGHRYNSPTTIDIAEPEPSREPEEVSDAIVIEPARPVPPPLTDRHEPALPVPTTPEVPADTTGRSDGIIKKDDGDVYSGTKSREEIGGYRPVDVTPAGEVRLSPPEYNQFQQPVQPRKSDLNAQVTDDNLYFDAFKTFVSQKTPYNFTHPIRLDGRLVINVRDSQGLPVPNAYVRVQTDNQAIWLGRADASGRLIYLPSLNSNYSYRGQLTVSAQQRGFSTDPVSVSPGASQVTVIFQQSPAVSAPTVDICFILDTTGSMREEIQTLQETLDIVVERIHQLPGQPSVRIGMVEYRDRTDQYITKVTQFTNNARWFRTQVLSRVSANGGGDKSESVQEALSVSVNSMSWNASDNAIRIAFLIGDAGPHLDYANDSDYRTTVNQASVKGIKIHALGCSGLEPVGELVFRTVAQTTGGCYAFITRGGNGGGAPHTGTSARPENDNSLDSVIEWLVTQDLNAYYQAMSNGQSQNPRGQR